MAYTATFRHGSPLRVDHTPAGNVSAGDVVESNNTVGVATDDIAAGILGSLAISAVFRFPLLDGDVPSQWQKMYWDSGNTVMTTIAGSNTPAGIAEAWNATTDTVDVALSAGNVT